MKRLLVAVATVAAVLFGTASAGSADTSSCVKGPWPADVEGRPANLHPLGDAGLYIWHTDRGWNLAVTHPDNSRVEFTGSVRTDGKLFGVERRTERRDHVVFAEDAGGVRYRFVNYGGLDGIAFRTRCSNRLVFNGQINGQTLRSDQVFIGADGHHPGGVPFVIERHA